MSKSRRTLIIDDKCYMRLKVEAAKSGETISDIVNRAIEKECTLIEKERAICSGKEDGK